MRLLTLALVLLAACGPLDPVDRSDAGTDSGVDSGTETQPAENQCQKACLDAGAEVDAGVIPSPVALGVSL